MEWGWGKAIQESPHTGRHLQWADETHYAAAAFSQAEAVLASEVLTATRKEFSPLICSLLPDFPSSSDLFY